MGFVLAALTIAWLPGAVTWRLLSRDSETGFLRETRFLVERPLWASLFLCTATGLMVIGWLGLILAQLGWFTPAMISISLAVYTLVCLGLLVWRHSRQAGPPPGIPKDENSPAIQSCHSFAEAQDKSERSEESPPRSEETLRSAQGDRRREEGCFHSSRRAGRPPGTPKDENNLAPQRCHSERSEESPYASPETPSLRSGQALHFVQGDRCGDGSYFRNRSPWETIVAAVLFVGALWLYSSLPAEYLSAFFDPGWYLNTAALVARTGALAFESQPFSALPPELRPLFFSSFSALRFDFPQLPESRSRGFFLTAFAVPDADDGTIRPYHPPLLSIWLALFYTFGGVRAALYVPALFGALGVLAMFLAGRALFGRGPGLLAALLLALSLPQVYYSRTSYAEVLAQFLVLVGLYALTAFAERTDWRYAALAGLAFGQALLTKVESVLIVIPLAIFWAAWLARQRGGFRSHHQDAPAPVLGCGRPEDRPQSEQDAPAPVLGCGRPEDGPQSESSDTLFRALLAFGLPFATLMGHALLLALTVNRLYVALNGYGVWSRLRTTLTLPALWLALAAAMVIAVAWLWLHGGSWRDLSVRHWLAQGPPPSVRRIMAWIVLLLATWSYFIQPLASSVMIGGGGASGTPGLVQLGRFLSPWGLWLGLAGLALLVDRGFVWRHAFFAGLVLTTGAIVLATPTISAGVSPLYAVRRQVPLVIPALLLLASYTLLDGWRYVSDFLRRSRPVARHPTARRGVGSLLEGYRLPVARLAQGLAILVLVAGLLGIARPYLRYREMRGTIAFVDRLAARFPPGALVLFEAVGADSHVGRFAAPLWAVHGIDALVLSPAAPLSKEVGRALALWTSDRQAVYWVSASPYPPAMVSGHRFELVGDELWESSAFSPNPAYPPQIEHLEIPFYIFKITAEVL